MDGRQLAYATYGDPEGIPVLVLHGTPGSRRLGSVFDRKANRAGIRILAPDRPGYGRSAAWPEYSVDDAGRVITAVLDDAGVRTAGLVAFSGGAPYALAAARTRPERITRVDVVSGATPPGISEHTPPMQRVLRTLATGTPLVLRGLFRGQAWLAARLDPTFVAAQYTTKERADALPDDVKEVIKADFVEAVARSRRGVVTELRHTATQWGNDLDGVDAEVTFWHGADDANVPVADARRLSAALPTARLHTLSAADHLQALLRSRAEILDAHRS
ncbi:alpha/beta fold hydrolase [Halobellus ruber]|uniref:alpha/beta fold hydrolase n=1 Tax=Halobellus ruber TaxID=2761102 RepID=UPI0031B5C6C1